jgi:peptidyl-prolyl cis-trans isomerase C
MQRQSRLVLTLMAALASGSLMAAEVANVNGVSIPQAKMDYIVKQVAERGAKDSPELRQRIKDDLVTKEIVAQEAARLGLDKQADVQMEIEFARQNVLLNAFVQDFFAKNPIPEAAVKAEYDKLKAQMPQGKEYKARHILVKTEQEANDVLAALKKGKKFDELAKEKSQDPGSKVNGGDLGWAMPENFVKEFSEAMTGLQKGQITQKPVKTQFGFHVIKLDDVRQAQGPSFDDVKTGLQQQMQRQALDKLIADLKAKAKVQ